MSMCPDDDWCEQCHGPIKGKSVAYIMFCHLAFWIVIYWPFDLSRVHRLLPYAGEIAYSCHCYGKNRAARRSA